MTTTDENSIATRSPKMVQLIHPKTSNFQNVSSNSRAVVQLPVGPTYYKTFLRFLKSGAEATQAEIEAQISSISVDVSGRRFYSPLSPAQWNGLTDYYDTEKGGGADNGYVVLDWAKYNMHQLPVAKAKLGLGTVDVENITIAIECGTLTNIDAVEVFHVTSAERRPLGAHVKIRKISLSHTTTGEDEIELLKAPGFAYKAIHVSAGNIDKFNFERNNVDIYQDTPLTLNNLELKSLGRTPLTNFLHVDFSKMGELSNLLWTGDPANRETQSQTLFLKPNFTTAPNAYEVIFEELHGFAL